MYVELVHRINGKFSLNFMDIHVCTMLNGIFPSRWQQKLSNWYQQPAEYNWNPLTVIHSHTHTTTALRCTSRTLSTLVYINLKQISQKGKLIRCLSLVTLTYFSFVAVNMTDNPLSHLPLHVTQERGNRPLTTSPLCTRLPLAASWRSACAAQYESPASHQLHTKWLSAVVHVHFVMCNHV